MPIRPTSPTNTRSLRSATLRSVRVGIPAALSLLLMLSGCGEKSPEELLKEANAELAAATQARDAARATLDQLDKRLAQAQAARDRAAEAFEKADARWLEAKEAVGQFATDEVLHREVNRALLAAPELEGTTIQARVRDRAVTLTGEAGAPDEPGAEPHAGSDLPPATPEGETAAPRLDL